MLVTFIYLQFILHTMLQLLILYSCEAVLQRRICKESPKENETTTTMSFEHKEKWYKLCLLLDWWGINIVHSVCGSCSKHDYPGRQPNVPSQEAGGVERGNGRCNYLWTRAFKQVTLLEMFRHEPTGYWNSIAAGDSGILISRCACICFYFDFIVLCLIFEMFSIIDF